MKGGAHEDAAMTFAEIGRRLGITRGGAWMLYRSAMRKLRKKPAMKSLAQLAAAKDSGDLNLLEPKS